MVNRVKGNIYMEICVNIIYDIYLHIFLKIYEIYTYTYMYNNIYIIYSNIL